MKSFRDPWFAISVNILIDFESLANLATLRNSLESVLSI
jgi:hypothetical protein